MINNQELRELVESYCKTYVAGKYDLGEVCGPDGRELYIQSILSNSIGEILLDILQRMGYHSSASILDYGCGLGGFIVAAEALGLNVLGTEIDPQAVAIGRSRVKKPENIVQISTSGLPFADETFDLVTSQLVVEHTEDPARYLSEAIRVLKPKGRLLLIAPNYFFPWEGHYRLFWLPYLLPISKSLFKLYLRLRGRNSRYLEGVNLRITPVYLKKILRRLGAGEMKDISIELFAAKFSQPKQIPLPRLAAFLNYHRQNPLIKMMIAFFIKTLKISQLYYPAVLVVTRE